MTFKSLSIVLLVFSAGAVLAHSGVKNPAVKARMDAMSGIGESLKVLGTMAKGQAEFDGAKARAAAKDIAALANQVPDLFRAEEDDPKSEAKPEIWSNFDDFAGHADELSEIARNAAAVIETPEDLLAAMKALGQNCSACHKDYRE